VRATGECLRFQIECLFDLEKLDLEGLDLESLRRKYDSQSEIYILEICN